MKKKSKTKRPRKPDPAGDMLRRAMKNPGIKEVMDVYNRIAAAQGAFFPFQQVIYPPYQTSSTSYTIRRNSTISVP